MFKNAMGKLIEKFTANEKESNARKVREALNYTTKVVRQTRVWSISDFACGLCL